MTRSFALPLRRISISHAWRALKNRNFKLYFFGQGISLVGNWMTRLAMGWLVYRLTHSALQLGIVSFAGQFIAFAIGPFAGVWVERLDRRRLLVWTQAAAAAQSFALAALALANVITLWEVVALAAFQGLINSFDMPARQSFLVQTVEDRNDLSNAIAINSSLVNGARLIGPAIAGLIVAAFGEGWCFLVDGFSYFAVIGSLMAMRLKPRQARPRSAGMLGEIKEGWNYVIGSTPIRTVLTLFALTSFLGFPCTVLLPVFAGEVLGGGAHTLGWLSAATGLGALISALSLALRRSIVGLGRAIQLAAGVLGIAMILFGLSHRLWLSLVLMGFVGFGLTQCAAAANAIVQSVVSDDKRARVMSYYTMTFFGTAPFGSLFAGMLAHNVGAPHTLIFSGICCVAGSLWFLTQLPKVQAAINPTPEDPKPPSERAGELLPGAVSPPSR